MTFTTYAKSLLAKQKQEGLSSSTLIYLLNRSIHGPKEKRFFAELMGVQMKTIQRSIAEAKKKGFLKS